MALAGQVQAKPRVGKPAPPFSLRDRQGALIALSDMAYPGKARARRPRQVVVLDFFRTDCKPCKQAIPKLVALQKKFKGRGVKVVLLALLEQEEGEQKLDRFLAGRKLPITVLVDSYNVAGKKYVVDSNNRVSLPAMFVIDRSGVLRGAFSGMKKTTLPALNTLITDLSK